MKLENGDYVQTGGTLKKISGEEALLQYAAMRLCTRRGAFVYAPCFGSRLAQISSHAADVGQQALQLVQEALAPMQTRVRVVLVQPEQDGVRVRLAAGTVEKEVQVPYAKAG